MAVVQCAGGAAAAYTAPAVEHHVPLPARLQLLNHIVPARTSSNVLGVLPRQIVSLYWYMGFWHAARHDTTSQHGRQGLLCSSQATETTVPKQARLQQHHCHHEHLPIN
jgi:hypothetical protein